MTILPKIIDTSNTTSRLMMPPTRPQVPMLITDCLSPADMLMGMLTGILTGTRMDMWWQTMDIGKTVRGKLLTCLVR